MKISELKNAPQWLKAAKTFNEDVEILQNGTVLWKNGIWEDGTWRGGAWENGIWKGGTWENGTWRGGIWENGIWENGIWKDGIWEDGYSTTKSKHRILIDSQGAVKIGRITKNISEWDEWFASTEEYETPRNTKAFRMIEAHYLSVRAYHQHLTK